MGLIDTADKAVGWRLAFVVLIAPAAYFAYTVIYNVFFHPLKDFPGPLWSKVSRIPYALMLARGRSSYEIQALHEQYGNIVRVAPSELAFLDPQAWQDIMGHRKPSELENIKEARYRENLFHSPDIIFSDRDDHRRFRRILAHGFSAQAMSDQQPLIMKYIDQLIDQLDTRSSAGDCPLDMTEWYNFTSFDIITDLTFGQPFDLVATGKYHPWVAAITGATKAGTVLQCKNFFPLVRWLITKLTPKMREEQDKFMQCAIDRVDERLQSGTKRPDFMQAILDHRGKGGMSPIETYANSSVLVFGGSETTSSALAGATYLCLSHPEVYIKVRNEVRSSFSSDSAIDLHSVAKLKYMGAMFEEAMRVYPPVPTNIGRRSPPGGNVVCGKFIPEDTTMTIWHIPMFHSEKHFKNPKKFVPERWLGDKEYENDNRAAFQPFHLGPRSCLGRNLAYAEMRVIIAKLFYNFDMELDASSKNWIDQEIYTMWVKPPLNVNMKPSAARRQATAQGAVVRT
ncbi:Isotrichodermin C-15 hydroxylase [Sphaceloma murrayae]|uniref:Isotrichodermin C-15 hydroxylase n=1 Tax=Sphaceloma murrayae TaxID=2082308 RepID=A0A2K1R1G3_9PEZI|nr:Isotrichodermin C-15 hydroxylase [Sphaceloma murrayae]